MIPGRSGVPPGQTAKIIVQAVNGSLQGVASDRVELTMTAVRAAEAKQAVAAEKPAAKGPANGNGHGHSNGNGQMAASRLG